MVKLINKETGVASRNQLAKRSAGAIIGVIIIIACCLAPANELLSHQALVSLGILAGAVSFWVCGTLSLGVTGIACCTLLYVLGAVPSFPEAFKGFTTLNVWFIMAIFCMTAIIERSSLGLRLARRIFSICGSSSKKLILAFMLLSAIFSVFMTDAGSCACTMGIAIGVLNGLDAKPGQSNLGKASLLGITFASYIGGFLTPVSHALNVVGSGLYEQIVGVQVNFVQWMLVGTPVGIIMIFVCWLFLIRTFPPEEIDLERVSAAINENVKVASWTSLDTKSLIFILGLPVLWVISSLLSIVDPTTITILGLALMFMPGIDLLDWEFFCKRVSWDVFLMLGGVMSIGAAIQSTGAGGAISTIATQSGILSFNPLLVMLVFGAISYYLMTALPISPAYITLTLPILIPYAVSAGINPLIPVVVLCGLLAGNFLLPFNPNSAVTFSGGYYSVSDMIKGGWKAAIVHIIVIPIVAYFVLGLCY